MPAAPEGFHKPTLTLAGESCVSILISGQVRALATIRTMTQYARTSREGAVALASLRLTERSELTAAVRRWGE